MLALELRKQGGTYRQIAEQLRAVDGVSPDYSEAQAYRDVTAELERLNLRLAEEAGSVRRLEVERIDELWAVLYPKARKGDYAAFDRCLSLMEKRARYLGLYAPAPVQADVGGEVVIRVVYGSVDGS